MQDIFFYDKEKYTNQLNPVKGYLEQLSHYISIKKGIPLDQAAPLARTVLREHFKDKAVKYFDRQENGDRIVGESTLLQYIINNIKAKNILVPTFTSYVNTSVKKSILSEFIFENVKRRSIAKKTSHKAKALGDMNLFTAKNNEQNMMKIYNNSLSGAFAQEACILHNPTAHSTLTSITRTITSLSNASNEKLIAGNRYYPRGIDIFNNIVYISTYANIPQIKETIELYNLYVPTIEDTVNVLRYSSDLYFVDKTYYDKHIIPYLTKLSPYHLAAICYSGDLYHLRKFNSNFVKNILEEIITPILVEDNSEDLVSKIYSINENVLSFVHVILFSSMKGKGKNYDEMKKLGIAGNIYHTALHVIETFRKYKPFFSCFFLNEIFPNNSYRLKNMRRRVVVLSDTDSTCFTLDEWVKWYNGSFSINDKTLALSACIGFIGAQSIINQLAIVSKMMNVDKNDLNTLAMKTEWFWLSFFPLEVSKHYFASASVQEGNIFKEPELEVKGVHIKNSAITKAITQKGNELVKYIFNRISKDEKVKFNYILSEMIAVENAIELSVLKGESSFLKKSKIKNKESYAQDETKSPYQRHQFWIDVFSHKYGTIVEPPYDVVKFPTIVETRPALKEWVESIEDIEFKDRLSNWIVVNNKTSLPTVYLNEQYVIGNGIPKEIVSIIDIKRIILDITLQYRMILEGLGVMLHEDKLIREQFNI